MKSFSIPSFLGTCFTNRIYLLLIGLILTILNISCTPSQAPLGAQLTITPETEPIIVPAPPTFTPTGGSSLPTIALEKELVTKPPPTFTPPYSQPTIRIPETELVTPIPTYESPKPPVWSSPTALPTISAVSNGYRFSVQHLTFGASRAFDERLVNDHEISWSPKEEGLFAFTSPTGEWQEVRGGLWPVTDIALGNVDGKNLQKLTRGFKPIFSPSGNLIAYLQYSENLDELYIKIIDLDSQKISMVTTIPRGGVFPILAWLSDTELLYYQDAVILFEYKSGQKQDLLSLANSSLKSSSPLKYLATAPQHDLMAVASGELLVILHRNEEKISVLQELEGVDNSAIAFSPDGKSLAYVSVLTRQVKVYPVDDATSVIELPSPHRGSARSITWAPDSASLIYLDADGLQMVNRDGSNVQRIETVVTETLLGVIWEPQGRQLLLSYDSQPIQSLPVIIK